MSSSTETPRITPSGLVTVAYLKAQLDGNNDHLGMFTPLVIDAINGIPLNSVSTAEVHEALFTRQGIAIPQSVLTTLLRRLTSAGKLRREAGRYYKSYNSLPVPNDLQSERERLKEAQIRIGRALQDHAQRRGLRVDSGSEGVDLLLRFLQAEQVGMLLGEKLRFLELPNPDEREMAITAEFVQQVVRDDPAFSSTLRRMMEGLVLYHAAFLPDLSAAMQKFKNLRVIFDSSLIRQILGYEGAAMQALMVETLAILKAVDVQCLVFEKTVEEIRRILKVYEYKLATTEGQQSLRPVPMARHFLTSRYSPSDVREMSALLDRSIVSAGFQIAKVPSRRKEHTLGEKELIRRLKSPGTPTDEIEPRVDHDVDCIAGVLQMREGNRSSRLEDCRAVFAASSPLLIRNARLWWLEDEHQEGIEPVVHIRALANLAWLKKPAIREDFKLTELIALCSAALRPTEETWSRFLRHLQHLRASNVLTSDEVTAILVSAMSDSMLHEAEETIENLEDIDAVTLDEVVDRVKNTYTAKAEEAIATLRTDYEGRLERLSEEKERIAHDLIARTQAIAADEKSRVAFLEKRSKSWGKKIRRIIQILANLVILVGAYNILREHPFRDTWIGKCTLATVVAFVGLEFIGLRSHISHWLDKFEAWIVDKIYNWLSATRSE